MKFLTILFSIIISYFPSSIFAASPYIQTSHKVYGIQVYISKDKHLKNIERWLTIIGSTEKGVETLKAIYKCGSRVSIYHNLNSSAEAGRTRAIASTNKGVDADILLNIDMPDKGEYLVPGLKQETVPFTADINLFHELSHARHKSCGTELTKDPEYQAIKDENIYRKQASKFFGYNYGQRGKVGILPLDY